MMMHKRRGTSLIETMVVVTLLGVMISATGVCLHGVYRVNQQTRKAIEHTSAVERLLLQFRADAHAATEASVEQGEEEESPRITLTELDGRTIVYHQQQSHVTRTVSRDGEVLHRDGYLLGRGAVAAWSVEGQSPSIASVDIAPPSAPGGSERHEHCEAIVSLVDAEKAP